MMVAGAGRVLTVIGALAAVSAGCRRSTRHESLVEVVRVEPVRTSVMGPRPVDYEMRFVECPGAPSELLRGDATFESCVRKYRSGQRLPVVIDHEWTAGGHYRWTVKRVGDCSTPKVSAPVAKDELVMVRECEDTVANGSRVGFRCRYVPEPSLVERCPWFRRW